MDPKTAAGYASVLYAIQNGEEVATGKCRWTSLACEGAGRQDTPDHVEKLLPLIFLSCRTRQTGFPVNKKAVEKFGDKFTLPGNLVTNGPLPACQLRTE